MDAVGETFEERSWRELEAGRLPLRAQERLAGLGGGFSSGLALGAQLALDEVGLVPLGQVMGLSVVHPGRWSGGSCGVGGRVVGRAAVNPSVVRIQQVSSWRDCLVDGWHRATSRLLEEAALLGADGVVDVRCDEQVVAGTGLVDEVRLVGTAVRSTGEARPRYVFASTLSGAETVALLRAGWSPVAVIPAIEIVIRHDDRSLRRVEISLQTGELVGFSELVTAAYDGVRRSLRASAARLGAEGVVLDRLHHRVMGRACPAVQDVADHLVRATGVATGIVRVPSTRRPEPRTAVTIGLSA